MKWLLLNLLLPMLAAGCSDMVGTWVSAPFTHHTYSPGEAGIQSTDGWLMTLVVNGQRDCVFHGELSVVAGDGDNHHSMEAGSPVVGTIIADWADGANLENVTIVKVSSSSATEFITATLDNGILHFHGLETGIKDGVVWGEVYEANLMRSPAVPEPAAPDEACPDLLGSWRSPKYDAHRLSEEEILHLRGMNMTLEVLEQQGCVFLASNSWSNNNMEAIEPLLGVILAGHEKVMMVEFPTLPVHPHAFWGYIAGELLGNNKLHFHHVGVSLDSDDDVTLFSTLLSRNGPVEPEVCTIDMLGKWQSPPWTGVIAQADGTTRFADYLSQTVVVDEQGPGGCTFHGTNYWSRADGSLSGQEPVFGELHTDGSMMLTEIPGHGVTGFGTGRVDDSGVWHWSMTSLNLTSPMLGFAFTTDFQRCVDCPNSGARSLLFGAGQGGLKCCK